MPYRANNILPSKALENIDSRLIGIKSLAQDKKAILSSSAGADVVLSLLENLVAQKALLGQQASKPGLPQYAKDQNDDQTYDMVAGAAEVMAAINAIIANIQATFPFDTFLVSANPRVYQQFPPTATATLRGLLDTLDASITVV